MSVNRRSFMCLAAAGALSACSHNKFRSYNGPPVTMVIVNKTGRRVQLMNGDKVLRTFPMELGFTPVGHKTTRGDGRTPEGMYRINRRNPNSSYHLSIGISYPDTADVARAQALGVNPGGDIFIHGTPREERGKDDWTAGCIAVSNKHMEQIYAMVRNGTPILILP